MRLVKIITITGAFLAALVPCGLVIALAFTLLPPWANWLGLAVLAGGIAAVYLRRRSQGVGFASEYSLLGRRPASKEGLL